MLQQRAVRVAQRNCRHLLEYVLEYVLATIGGIRECRPLAASVLGVAVTFKRTAIAKVDRQTVPVRFFTLTIF